MSGAYDLFQTSENLEASGVWINYGSFAIKIAAAGFGNTEFTKLRTELLKPFRHQIQSGGMSEEDMKGVEQELYATTVLLDWQEFEDKNGEEMECTIGNKIKVFLELPRFYADILRMASDLTKFREEDEAQDAKNSQSV